MLDLGTALAGELAHRVDAGVLGKKPQRGGGDVVIVTAHAGVTGRGQDECTGGPAATATRATSGGGLVLLNGTFLGEQVEVTADRGGRQPQARGEGERGERAVLGDRLPDPVPGACLKNVRTGVGPVCTVEKSVVSDKHNNIVS